MSIILKKVKPVMDKIMLAWYGHVMACQTRQ